MACPEKNANQTWLLKFRSYHWDYEHKQKHEENHFYRKMTKNIYAIFQQESNFCIKNAFPLPFPLAAIFRYREGFGKTAITLRI